MTLYEFQQENGINQAIVFDGNIHRFKKYHHKSPSSWYIGFAKYENNETYQYLIVGDWREGEETQSWSSHDKNQFNEEFKEKIKKAKDDYKQKQETKYLKSQKLAQYIWNNSKKYNPEQNPYLINKKVANTHETRFFEKQECIIIPRFDAEGNIWSFQKIFKDGKKMFQAGGKTIGTHFIINPQENPNKIYICEGFATGSSCSLVIADPIVIAFNANNIEGTYLELQKKYPNCEFFTLADNDQFTVIKKPNGEQFPYNTGLAVAENIYKKYKVPYFFPRFDNIENEPTDFNDLYCLEGLEELRLQLSTSLCTKYPSMPDGFFVHIKPKSGNGDGRWIPDYKSMAQYFKNEMYLKCDDSYSVVYKNGFFKNISKTGIENAIYKLSKLKAQPHVIGNFRKTVMPYSYFPKDDFEQAKGFINLKSGALNIKTKEIKEHSPDYNFTYKLNHDFDENAKCPRFIEFLNFIFDKNQDMIKLIGEIMAYTIIGGEPFKHRAFMFYGSGRNGKSTLLDVIKELLGEKNVSSVSMKLIDKPFSAVRLDGKLANIVEESPSSIDPETFKNIVGGGTVSAAYKTKDEFDLKVNARLFFACNEFPRFKDSTVAIKDRLIVVPFEKYIASEDRDATIGEKLKAEMPGILNFVLESLNRFQEQKYQFTKVAKTEEALEEYINETDSVALWYSENIEETESAETFLKLNDLYDAYKKTTIEDGMSPVSKNNFSKRFKTKVTDEYLRYTQKKIDGRNYRGYTGMNCVDPNFLLESKNNGYMRQYSMPYTN